VADLFEGYALGEAWDAVFTAAGAPREHSTPLVDALRALSREDLDVRAGLAPHDAALAIMDLAHEQVAYVPGSTGVATAREPWALGSGVCQSIAHVAIALLSAVGLPASYVSGYLHPRADTAVGETFTGESHAWVEVWLGAWWAYDPTNRIPAGRSPSASRSR